MLQEQEVILIIVSFSLERNSTPTPTPLPLLKGPHLLSQMHPRYHQRGSIVETPVSSSFTTEATLSELVLKDSDLTQEVYWARMLKLITSVVL